MQRQLQIADGEVESLTALIRYMDKETARRDVDHMGDATFKGTLRLRYCVMPGNSGLGTVVDFQVSTSYLIDLARTKVMCLHALDLACLRLNPHYAHCCEGSVQSASPNFDQNYSLYVVVLKVNIGQFP